MKNWWNKCEHCPKCLLWIDMGSDYLDSYKGCAKQNKRDYLISECTLTEEQYKIIVKEWKMKICKEDHNYYRINTDAACEHFEGDLTYLNTFCVKGAYQPVAVFKNANPDRSKNHKDYMLLWVDVTVVISGMDADEMEKYRYQKGMYCPDCKDVIYSVNRHDYRHCSCGRCMVDGGKDYFKTNMAGKEVKIDLLTDIIEVI